MLGSPRNGLSGPSTALFWARVWPAVRISAIESKGSIREFKFQLPVFEFQIKSNQIKFQISNFKFQISNLAGCLQFGGKPFLVSGVCVGIFPSVLTVVDPSQCPTRAVGGAIGIRAMNGQRVMHQ